MSLSHFTTPQELDDADNVDLDGLLNGTEPRTVCCFRPVRHDCLFAACEHGDHDEARDDLPCVVYAPENHVLAHFPCQNRRSREQAIAEADRLWNQELLRTRENPLEY